jgi:molybdopterin synthase catalytic subunit
MENSAHRAERSAESAPFGSAATPSDPAGRPLPGQQAETIQPLSASPWQGLAPHGAGAELELRLSEEPFSPLDVLGRWQQRLAQRPQGAPAAESHFLGRVRAIGGAGECVAALELEHYPGMTEAQIELLARNAAVRHGVVAVLVWHRVGRVLPGETIVLVAVAADRRGPAQRCGQELLEALKHEAPFWKRELRPDGTGHWVQGNTAL